MSNRMSIVNDIICAYELVSYPESFSFIAGDSFLPGVKEKKLLVFPEYCSKASLLSSKFVQQILSLK